MAKRTGAGQTTAQQARATAASERELGDAELARVAGGLRDSEGRVGSLTVTGTTISGNRAG